MPGLRRRNYLVKENPNVLNIQLSQDQLRSPGVAEALRNLVLALGGSAPIKAERRKTVRRPRPRKKSVYATWAEFADTLTIDTQQFLQELEERRTMTVDEIKSALALPGKAVGGTIGAMTRKTVNCGFAVPYKQSFVNGVRTYTWTGDSAA